MELDARGVGCSSSCSSSKGRHKYDVFLSFRGEDTRRSFTAHLYAALQRYELKTFRDDEELERGQVIKHGLNQAIEESFCAIVVLSEKYATSTWCLDELQRILDSRKMAGLVFPIFYRVDPSCVRRQTGSFAKAFQKHEQDYVLDKMKVKGWRKAFKEVAGIAGWSYKDYRDETELIRSVVKKVRLKLKPPVPTCKAIFEDVQGGAYMELNDSNDRVNRNNVGLETGCSKGYKLPTTDLVGEEYQIYTRQIWEWIMGDEVSAIGIWGMGGAGKTALATHMHNKLLDEVGDDFDHIIWVTVSRNDNSIYKLQKDIARSINLDISDECDVKRISGKLLQASKHKKRCVLILDDVWDPIYLEEIGFPLSKNRIKLILTTCSLDVCQSMDCMKNTINVKPLHEEDGWNLFKRTIGIHQMQSSEVEHIAKSVVNQCGGLPLAIVTIARSMKGKEHRGDWNHLLECLENLDNRHYHMDDRVFPVLKLSYACLNDELQSFFLYYALRGKEHVYDHYFEPLIRRFFFEGWTGKKKSSMMQHIEGYSMLGGLEYKSLLIKEYGRWRMHILLRVMAINIAKKTGEILAKPGMNLIDLPENEEWKENLQKAFLTESNIQKIQDGTSPKCSKLSMLLLDYNYNLKKIPNDFFNNMPTLKILDLSRTGIERLPTSVSNLECLIILLLSGCEELSEVPSLAKLQRLIELDLSFTAITKAPCGLELLVNLKCLNLAYTDRLEMSSSTISRMIDLQSLRLVNCIPESMDVSAQDLQGLRKLEVISVNFCDIGEFNAYVKSFLDRDHRLKSYCLSLATVFDYASLVGAPKAYSLKRVVLCGIDLANKAVLPEDINELFISQCELEDLKQIMAPIAPFLDIPFLYLRDLQICGCSKMKILIVSEFFAQLENLETISVESCGSMVQMVGEDYWSSSTSNPPITLRNVRSVKLKGLPKLTSIFRGTMFFPSLKYFHASGCEKLRHPKIENKEGDKLHMEKIWTGYSWKCNDQGESSNSSERKWNSW